MHTAVRMLLRTRQKTLLLRFLPDYIIKKGFQIHSFVLISICVANNGHLIDTIMLNLFRMSISTQRHHYPRAQSLWESRKIQEGGTDGP